MTAFIEFGYGTRKKVFSLDGMAEACAQSMNDLAEQFNEEATACTIKGSFMEHLILEKHLNTKAFQIFRMFITRTKLTSR